MIMYEFLAILTNMVTGEPHQIEINIETSVYYSTLPREDNLSVGEWAWKCAALQAFRHQTENRYWWLTSITYIRSY